jgi:hypothetical protein
MTPRAGGGTLGAMSSRAAVTDRPAPAPPAAPAAPADAARRRALVRLQADVTTLRARLAEVVAATRALAAAEAARDPRYTGMTFEEVEPELRAEAGAADESTWEKIKREVREGFTGARER